MNNRVFWGAIALAVAGILAAASIGDAARRIDRDGVLIAGHDGVDQQIAKIDSTGAVLTNTQGPAADDAAASGNPVPAGCKYNSTLNTVEDGDISYLNCGTRGSLNVTLFSADSTSSVATSSINGDSVSASGTGIMAGTFGRIYNGSTYDRERGNTDITVLASAARTGTTNSSDLTNYNGKGAHVVIDVTAASATPSVVCTIQGKDALSSQYYTILASAAITGVGTTVMRVFPAATAAANVTANDIIPRTWRLNCVHADGDSITYSIGASVIL